MMVKVQGYDFNVRYRPGNEMILADMFSRLPNKSEAIQLDSHVDQILLEDTDNIKMDILNFSSTKQGQIRHETARDSTLSSLSQVIFTGW